MGPKVVVVAAGKVKEGERLVSRCREADLVIAADGGTAHLTAAGLAPDIVVGDLDSWAGRLPDGVQVRKSPRDKDATDLELALEEAARHQPAEVHLFGAIGSRFDHSLAAVNLLGRFDFPIVLYHAPDTMYLVRGQFEAAGKAGDRVSLIPLTDVAGGVRTWGLRFPLFGEDLLRASTRGISNEVTSSPWGLSLRAGKLLVIHSPVKAGGER